jgi:carboxypeptidase C (cathepsin A)
MGSWGDIADLLFVDQPVGTGFSYGNNGTLLDRLEAGAMEMVNFTQ